MKINFKILTIACMCALFFSSCEEDFDPVAYGDSVSKSVDPFFQVLTPLVSFDGAPEYNYRFIAIPGESGASTVDAVITFFDAATGETTEERPFGSFEIGSGTTTEVASTFDYDTMRGIFPELPADQTSVKLGSEWNITLNQVAGGTNVVSSAIKVAVISPFAGLYRVLESAYWRINVDSGNWNGDERFIGSIDDDTFSYNDFWGPFGWAGNFIEFDIDFDTGKVTVQETHGGEPFPLFSGNFILTCQEEPGDFVDVPCDDGGSNVLEIQPNGKHILKMTYGYMSDSGSRQFFEVLEKIVN